MQLKQQYNLPHKLTQSEKELFSLLSLSLPQRNEWSKTTLSSKNVLKMQLWLSHTAAQLPAIM